MIGGILFFVSFVVFAAGFQKKRKDGGYEGGSCLLEILGAILGIIAIALLSSGI